MKLYLIAGVLGVLVVSGLSMDATLEHEIPALLKLANDVSEEAKRGGGDVLHHLHCLELHKAGYCKYGLIKNKFCQRTCFLCNIEPLGMQSGVIPDARITASSMWNGNHAPAQGRLNYNPPRGKSGSWSSRHNRVGQWIQVDLNRVTKVTGIATQGRSDANQWVKKYKLQYSSDGKTFINYEGGKVFAANKDRNSVVKHDLHNPIIARLMKLLKTNTNLRAVHNNMKLYLMAGLLAVLVVSGLSMNATLEDGFPALLKLPNDVSEEAKRGGGDVLHRLHCLELHKAGYCKYDLIENKFCQKTCSSCSDVLDQECCKTLKDKDECGSAWGLKYCSQTCHKCFVCNIEPLGMQSGAIPDARITASSMWNGNHAPAQGRLNYKPPRGKSGSWSSRHNRVGQWIQVDLNRLTKVTGIATQGRSDANQWVKQYKLQYSSDGKTFNNYEEGKVFTANKNRNSVVKHDLHNPIIASGAIPDARITASSMWNGNHAPAQGRINYNPPRGKAGSWSSRHNRVGQWIQVDLNRVTKVTGIATQGRSDANQWVKKYKLQYSSDGKTFNNYEEGKVFTANKDRNSVVKHNLYHPIIARSLTAKPVRESK
ncbi:hypothetical protein QZH41_007184 [Actinostola sp. cb2023]|nr:hypothetical protein QZH41_007184 [Actinostola sp. cb2023]